MVEYVTETGLVVTDRRHHRADVLPPRDNPPNGNVQPSPPVSVGPDASEGFGNTHVMYPAEMAGLVPQAWSGWPVEWATPRWGSSIGLDEAMNRVSTVWAALDLNSAVLATMPPYRTQGNTIIPSLPWMANPQPEVYTGWIEAMKQVVISYQLGEAFLWATSRYADHSVKTWVMLNPSWVNVELTGQIRRITMFGVDITDDVLHIRYASWPGDPRGHGSLEAAALNLFGAEALERYAANLAVRGGIPWATLTAPGNLSEAQATTMRDRFVLARMSALGAPAVLSGGVKLEPLTINPRDMALIELRQMSEARLAVLLGCPPTLIGLPTGDTSMTYRNVEGIYDFHWRSSLRPKAAELMEAISQWALPRGQAVEVNRDEYVRPALNERATAYQTLFNIYDPDTGQRAITIDEIRTAERFDTRDDVPTTSVSVA